MSSELLYGEYLRFIKSRRLALVNLRSGPIAERFLPRILTRDEFELRWNAASVECRSELEKTWIAGFEAYRKRVASCFTNSLIQLLACQRNSAA
jgi:hypothetical protein